MIELAQNYLCFIKDDFPAVHVYSRHAFAH